MKLMRLAQNVILARVAWSYIARRRQALARERRMRRIAPVLIAGGAGIVWAARPRILSGAHRVLDLMRRGLDGNAEARQQPDDAGVRKEPDTEARQVRERRSEVHRANTDQRPSEQGKSNGGGRARGASTASAETSAEPPKPSPKKRRKRARQKRAAQRENAERETAHGGAVKVEINQPEDLRVPLGEIKH
jgi:hypothetical protein